METVAFVICFGVGFFIGLWYSAYTERKQRERLIKGYHYGPDV